MDLRPTRAGVAAAAAALLLGACATTPRHPSPGSVPPPPADIASIPDAVPRAEPRSRHGNPPYYEVYGRRYQVLASADGYTERGVASWYGPDFHGHNTSNGEPYDMYGMTAAHRTLPIPCYARITNLGNGRSVVVRINDRGPFVANRIVDLSYSAAARLDIVRTGTAFVELRTVGPEEVPGGASTPVVAATSSTPVPAPLPVPSPVAAPATAAGAPAQEPPAPLTAVALYIQVGAFADERNAQRLVERLQAAGIPRVFTLASSASGQLLRRVRIGPIASVEEFDQLAARLADLGYPEAQLAND